MTHAAVCQLLVTVSLMLGLPLIAQAEPYLAVEQGLKCVACHVNPTGGGLRNGAGVLYARYTLPAHQLPNGLTDWTGRIGDFIRIGGDFRASASRTEVPNMTNQRATEIDQLRLYGDVELIADRLGLYVDEMLAPGNAMAQEAYLRYAGMGMAWYVKGGQFYLPFGWRLQDHTAFVRLVSGISMTSSDKGIELGLERSAWSAQLALTQGPGNAGTGSGHQLTGQIVWVQDWGRIGAAAASTSAQAGNRQVAGLFGGLRTGPLVWLGEVDLVRDDGYPEGRRRLLAALGEVNWRLSQGNNLKLTGEYFDPDRHVRQDHKVRQSLVYEYSPIPFVQLRFGLRRHRGIPQNNFDNRQLAFAEIHGLF